MSNTRISIICPDMSRNVFGRAYVLARVLKRSFPVQVIGPQFGRGVWAPMAGMLEAEGIQVCSIPSSMYPRFLSSAVKLWQGIDGDLIYAVKPYPTSFGVGMAYRKRKHVPLILDIDDWELGGQLAMSRKKRLSIYLRGWSSPNNRYLVERLYSYVKDADAITVSSHFLQEKYGGVLVPHGRDTDEMDPAKVNGDEIRRKFGLTGRIVMFFGTPRPHKGIEDLIAAVEQLKRPDVTCVIVGANLQDPYDASLQRLDNAEIVLLPMQSFDSVPAFMAAADVVVIPQRQSAFTEAQMPAKIYDAMAMGRPIVATAISDIPETLAGCGMVVPPGDVNALAAAIANLLDHPEEARQLGLAARGKVCPIVWLGCHASYFGNTCGKRNGKLATVTDSPSEVTRSGESPYYAGACTDLMALVPAGATRILDVGCGAGKLGQALKMEKPRYVAGVELFAESAAMAATVLDKAVCASVEEVPLEELGPAASFDCIIFGDILEHLLDPWKTLRRFATLLTPDGVVVASIPNVGHVSVIASLLRGRWEYGDRGLLDRTHLRFFTYRSIQQLFQQAGLKISDCNGNYRMVDRDKRYAKLARGMAKGPFKGLFTYQYLIVAHPGSTSQ